MSEERVGIKIGVGEVDEEPEDLKVIIELSTSLTWWAWSPEQAVAFALKILEAAASISGSSSMKMEGEMENVGIKINLISSTRIH